jgi:hypothetical protein
MPRSNRDRRLEIGRRWCLLLRLNSTGETEVGGRHGCWVGWAQARATVHEMQWGLTLRDLEDKGNRFCKLTTKETVEGEWARRRGSVDAWRRWGQPPVVLQLWGAALQLRLAPLKLLLGSIASDVDESSSCSGYLRALGFGACRAKFNDYGPLFIWLFGPTRRGDEVLRFLYTNQTLTRLCLGDFWKGMDLS